MKRRLVRALLLTIVLLALTGPAPAQTNEVDWQKRLQEIFATRAAWLLADSPSRPLEADFLTKSEPASWALEHEQGKIRYVRKWAELRGVRWVEAVPDFSFKVLKQEDDRVRILVRESLTLGYSYLGSSAVERFGVGAAHILELRRQADRWLIRSEWYEDALGSGPETPDATRGSLPADVTPDLPLAAGGRYNRQGAVDYANQYCGLAWGCGNAHRYNRGYRDYNGNGGDCTNFVSQALRLGGQLPIPVIIRVETLAARLQSAGLAQVVVRAPMNKLWDTAVASKAGFRSRLREGDVISYMERGDLEHFAIVTGFDSHGYPLVNSHTADRYHVPFDLGWDKATVYWLFRMKS